MIFMKIGTPGILEAFGADGQGEFFLPKRRLIIVRLRMRMWLDSWCVLNLQFKMFSTHFLCPRASTQQ